jgi:hypothetical protein
MSTLFDEVASPEAPGEDNKGASATSTERKRLMVVGGAGAAVVLLALGYFVVVPAISGGSDNTSQPAPVVTHQGVAASPSESAKAKATASPSSVPTIPAVQNALQTGRDPFAPLVVAAVDASTPSAASSPSTGSSSTGGTSTTGTAGTTSGGTTGATPTPSVSTVSSTGTLVLKRIYQQDGLWHVDVTWNGQAFSAVQGADFAGIFSFVSQSGGKTASFTYGGGQHFSLVLNGTKTF